MNCVWSHSLKWGSWTFINYGAFISLHFEVVNGIILLILELPAKYNVNRNYLDFIRGRYRDNSPHTSSLGNQSSSIWQIFIPCKIAGHGHYRTKATPLSWSWMCLTRDTAEACTICPIYIERITIRASVAYKC